MANQANTANRIIPAAKWLASMLDSRCRAQLRVCRYHNRRGSFGARDQSTTEEWIVFVEHGVLLMMVNGRERRLHAGEALWLPPRTHYHVLGAAGRTNVRQYNVRFTLRSGRRVLSHSRKPILAVAAWDMQPLLQMLAGMALWPRPFSQIRFRALLATVTATFLSHCGPAQQSSHVLRPAQRQSISDFIAAHAAQPISPAQLAEVTNLSPDYFARVFRKTYETTPRAYIKAERMRQAATRLSESSLTVKEIARETGAQNISLFCRQFRQVLGCTPSEYRQRSAP
jgi:AraC-like DNA-binding protein